MKYKYDIQPNLLFEEDWLEYLNQMHDKGWKLNKIGILFNRFEKCHTPFKYQIDFTPLSQEYLQVTQSLGYQYIDSFKNTHIFCNDDILATDLQTDEEIVKDVLLKKFSIKRIILTFIISLLYGCLGIPMLSCFFPFYLGYFFIYFENFLISFSLVLLSLLFLIISLAFFKARRKVINHTSMEIQSKLIRIILKIIIYIIFGAFFLILICFFSNNNYIIYVCFNGVILFILYYMIQRFIPKQTSETTRKILLFLSITICISIHTLFNNQFMTNQTNAIDFQEKNIIKNDDNILVKKTMITSPSLQVHYDCYNTSIANEVLKVNIQCLQSKDSLLLNDDIDSQDIKPYQDTIQYYHVYSSSLVDKCYYTHDYFIAKKDNIVIRCYIDKKEDIDKILKEYFN